MRLFSANHNLDGATSVRGRSKRRFPAMRPLSMSLHKGERACTVKVSGKHQWDGSQYSRGMNCLRVWSWGRIYNKPDDSGYVVAVLVAPLSIADSLSRVFSFSRLEKYVPLVVYHSPASNWSCGGSLAKLLSSLRNVTCFTNLLIAGGFNSLSVGWSGAATTKPWFTKNLAVAVLRNSRKQRKVPHLISNRPDRIFALPRHYQRAPQKQTGHLSAATRKSDHQFLVFNFTVKC